MRANESIHRAGDTSDAKRWVRTGVVLLGFLAVAGFLLFSEHRAHVLGSLIYLLPLVCIVMHFFMHGGHGGHSAHRRDNQGQAP